MYISRSPTFQIILHCPFLIVFYKNIFVFVNQIPSGAKCQKWWATYTAPQKVVNLPKYPHPPVPTWCAVLTSRCFRQHNSSALCATKRSRKRTRTKTTCARTRQPRRWCCPRPHLSPPPRRPCHRQGQHQPRWPPPAMTPTPALFAARLLPCRPV